MATQKVSFQRLIGKKFLWVSLVVVSILFSPIISEAKSDWEFYFFGVNMNKITEGNAVEVLTGAIASILTHELGHMLYLESQNKDWKTTTSSFGIGVWSDEHFTDNQYVKSGFAGFALQLGVGAILLSFDGTEDSDFTKGWIGLSSVQLMTLDIRGNDDLQRE